MKNGLFRVMLLVLLCTGCATHEYRPADAAQTTLPEYNFEASKGVVYTPPDWPAELKADVFAPKGAGPFPAVLVVHGGGWSSGNRGSMTSIAKALASAGFVAVNVSYRLAPEAQFPKQLYDLQQAMHWIHDNAGQYRIDPTRIGGFGYSAGAHLVSLLAVIQDDDALDAPHGGPQSRLQAVASGGTPADLLAYEESGRLLRQFLGGTKQEFPERYAAASPITHVSAAAPPFFLYHGQWDTLVPIRQAERFAQALQQAGVHVELYRLKFRGHIGAYFFGGSAEEAAVRFLRRMLATPDA